jgi:hypothetical protein
MRFLALLTTGTLILIVAAFACSEGDKDASTLTPTSTPTSTSTLTPTSTITPAPTTQPDSTPSPDSRSAILISPPEDRAAFLDELADKQIMNENCPYEADSARADCGDKGLYELVPPLPGDVGVCAISLVEGNPIALICSAPATAVVYEIP